MLVNVILDADGYELVGEIQIHLREIHKVCLCENRATESINGAIGLICGAQPRVLK